MRAVYNITLSDDVNEKLNFLAENKCTTRADIIRMLTQDVEISDKYRELKKEYNLKDK